MNKMYYILENISERDETFCRFYYEAKSFTEEEKQKKYLKVCLGSFRQ